MTDRMKELSAKALAQKVGYLKSDDLPGDFESLQEITFYPGKNIKSKDNLYLIKTGSVIIHHAHHKYFIKDLSPGCVFGNLPLLGQTILFTEATAGTEGATLAIIDVQIAARWIQKNPIKILELVGPRLCAMETDQYRTRFQLVDSRVAALLLQLSADNVLEGFSHEELGEILGVYRETVTMALSVMEEDRVIGTARRRITILDKKALKEISEL